MSLNNPICQSGCLIVPPDLNFNDCSPEVHEGEVDRVFFASLGADELFNWLLLPEWTTRLSNTSTDINAIRFMNVVGEKPVAESNILKISRNRKTVLAKNHTLPFDVDETTDENYDALRQLECYGNFRWWFSTAGGLLYGGNEGIQAFLDWNLMIPKDRVDLELFIGLLSWDAKFHPERGTNPMA